MVWEWDERGGIFILGGEGVQSIRDVRYVV